MISNYGFIILLEHKNPGCGSEGNILSNNYCEEINLTFVYFTDMHCNELNKTMKFHNVDVLPVCTCKQESWCHFCKLQKDPESKEVEVKRYTKGGYFGGMIYY